MIEKRTPGNGARSLAPRGGAEIGHGISFAPTIDRYAAISAEVEQAQQSRQEWERFCGKKTRLLNGSIKKCGV